MMADFTATAFLIEPFCDTAEIHGIRWEHVSRFDPASGVLEQIWRNGTTAMTELCWPARIVNYDTIANEAGWTIWSRAGWNPQDRDTPFREEWADQTRYVTIYARTAEPNGPSSALSLCSSIWSTSAGRFGGSTAWLIWRLEMTSPFPSGALYRRQIIRLLDDARKMVTARRGHPVCNGARPSEVKPSSTQSASSATNRLASFGRCSSGIVMTRATIWNSSPKMSKTFCSDPDALSSRQRVHSDTNT